MVYGSKGKRVYRKASKAKPRKARKPAGVKKLANDVRILQRKVAGEKKIFYSQLVPGTVLGQCNVNGDATWALDMTPRPPQGTGYGARIGRQIRLVSMSLQYQIIQQTTTNHPIRIRFYMVKIVGVPQNSTVMYQQFMVPNPITGVRDLMAVRNINYWKDYRVIKSWSCYLPQDQAPNNLSIKTGRVNMKLNHYVNFDGDTTTVNDGQLMLFAFADAGNCGVTNSTLPNVAVQTYNTGCDVQTYTKFWFTDN